MTLSDQKHVASSQTDDEECPEVTEPSTAKPVSRRRDKSTIHRMVTIIKLT